MELKPTYEELQKENEKLRNEARIINITLNSSIDPIYITSPNYEIEYLNTQMENIVGENNIGTKCYKTMYGRDEICEWCVVDKLVSCKEITYEIKHPIFNKNNIVKNSLLQSGSIISTFHDVTDLVKKQQKLLKQNKELVINKLRYETFFKDSYSVMLLIDPENGNIIEANNAAVDFYGYSIDEIKKMNIYQINILSKSEVSRKMQSVSLLERNIFFLKHKLKNNSIRDVEVHSGKVTFASKNYLYSIIFDITERLKTEDALKVSEQKLKELNVTKDKFFSIIAHDLKSPFNAILGFSDLLLDNHEKYDVEKREKIIKLVNKSANTAFDLLENLLTWSRSQSGKINYSSEKLDLKPLLIDVLHDLQVVATKKNIQIVDEIYEKEIIIADKNMISFVLRNLISNAIKFTDKNGRVTVFSMKFDNNFHEISVYDTGMGISEDRIRDLFLVDKNISTPDTENETGTGLGLILCKEFVEKHGGKICVESKVNVGTKISFTVPSFSM